MSTRSASGLEHQPRFHAGRGIADANAHHEPVELRLGQRKGAGEVLGVLRGDHQERLGQRQRAAVERHLTVVHRLEQRRLGARARAVDFVGEQDVREDRTLAQHELATPLIVDRHTEHVARQEVARELDASQLAAHRPGERARQRRLADARYVLDQNVPAREQRDQRQLDGVGLALQRAFDGPAEFDQALDALGVDHHGRRRHCGHRSMGYATGPSNERLSAKSKGVKPRPVGSPGESVVFEGRWSESSASRFVGSRACSVPRRRCAG